MWTWPRMRSHKSSLAPLTLANHPTQFECPFCSCGRRAGLHRPRPRTSRKLRATSERGTSLRALARVSQNYCRAASEHVAPGRATTNSEVWLCPTLQSKLLSYGYCRRAQAPGRQDAGIQARSVLSRSRLVAPVNERWKIQSLERLRFTRGTQSFVA